jgi:hypothetical protein
VLGVVAGASVARPIRFGNPRFLAPQQGKLG